MLPPRTPRIRAVALAAPGVLALLAPGCFLLSLDGYAGDAGSDATSQPDGATPPDASADSPVDASASDASPLDAHGNDAPMAIDGGCAAVNVLPNTLVDGSLGAWSAYPSSATLVWSDDAGAALVTNGDAAGGFSINWVDAVVDAAADAVYTATAYVAAGNPGAVHESYQFVIQETGALCDGTGPCYGATYPSLAASLTKVSGPIFAVQHAGDALKTYIYVDQGGPGDSFLVRDVTMSLACGDGG
jgi:hypothetical protein